MIKYFAFCMTLNIGAMEWFHTPVDPPISGTIRREDSRTTYIPDPSPIRRKTEHTYDISETDIEREMEIPPEVPSGWRVWLFGCWSRKYSD